MAIQDDNTVLSKGDLKEYHQKILPYLGGNLMLGTNVSDYYSTDEKIVGVWTDGKPLYQKTFIGNFTPSTAQRVYTQLADLSSLNIDKSTNCNGVVKEQSGYFKFLNVSDKGDAAVYTIAITDDKKLSILTTGTNQQTDYIITLQYTKTTDAANSAVSTPGCYDLNRPDLWTANQEIFFGNGLYGSRLIGNATLEVGVRQDVIFTGSITNNTRLVSQGGQLKTPNNWSLPLAMSFSLTHEVPRMEAFIFPLYTEGKLRMYMLVNNSNDAGTYNYDVWVTYTK